MKILFNGCSMVEMGNCDHVPNWQDLVWPKLVADHLNASYTNLAVSMSSNRRILRTTLEQLVTDKPDIAVIGWTNMDRIELPLTNGDWARIAPGGCISEKSDPVSPHHEYYYRHHYNNWVAFTQTVQCMYLLTEMCEKFKTKLYFLNSIFHNYLTDYNQILKKNFYFLKGYTTTHATQIAQETQSIDLMLKKILNQNWLLDPSKTIVDFCKINHLKVDTWGHPAVESQSAISDAITKKII